MRYRRCAFAVPAIVAVGIAAGVWHGATEAAPPAQGTPVFKVDPYWPKPLPDNWVTGEVGGTCIDSQDHVFIVTRGFQTGGLTSPEGVGGANPETGALSSSRAPRRPSSSSIRAAMSSTAWGDPSLVPARATASPDRTPCCPMASTAASSITRTTSGSAATATASCRSIPTTAARCCCRSASSSRATTVSDDEPSRARGTGGAATVGTDADRLEPDASEPAGGHRRRSESGSDQRAEG